LPTSLPLKMPVRDKRSPDTVRAKVMSLFDDSMVIFAYLTPSLLE
jgi:hypothetical protein